MYRKRPYIEIENTDIVIEGVKNIVNEITKLGNLVGLEIYPGVDLSDVIQVLKEDNKVNLINVEKYYLDKMTYLNQIKPSITDDRIFGKNTFYDFKDFFIEDYSLNFKNDLKENKINIVYGSGVSYLDDVMPLVYFDITRWEIQQRQRNQSFGNWNMDNLGMDPLTQYKIGYFVDWKMANKLKYAIQDRIVYQVDANQQNNFVMISQRDYLNCLETTAKQPFRLVPFFDSAPWGGQWMKDKFDLDKDKQNYGWSFDGVPDENSLLYKIDGFEFEIPAANLVGLKAEAVLGERVKSIFGNNFPIRFNYLDTMGGGNLSLQVHPKSEYIQREFGMPFTQDESYYIMDGKEDAKVYLGLKPNKDKTEMFEALRYSNDTGENFDELEYVNEFSVKKHDHVLIPAGTIHCSGPNTVVLEISTTVNWFTFKLWDWGRLGLDGKPRPVHLNHGIHNVDMSRDTDYCQRELINVFETLYEDDSQKIEKTGLHHLEYIETHRHWIQSTGTIQNHDSVSVLNLVEGEHIKVHYSGRTYDVYYGETFIMPAVLDEVKVENMTPSSKVGIMQAFIK